ncbi:MAG: hypothetical protein ABII22_04990 [Candidatus Micrarchaeota archaeon]
MNEAKITDGITEQEQINRLLKDVGNPLNRKMLVELAKVSPTSFENVLSAALGPHNFISEGESEATNELLIELNELFVQTKKTDPSFDIKPSVLLKITFVMAKNLVENRDNSRSMDYDGRNARRTKTLSKTLIEIAKKHTPSVTKILCMLSVSNPETAEFLLSIALEIYHMEERHPDLVPRILMECLNEDCGAKIQNWNAYHNAFYRMGRMNMEVLVSALHDFHKANDNQATQRMIAGILDYLAHPTRFGKSTYRNMEPLARRERTKSFDTTFQSSPSKPKNGRNGINANGTGPIAYHRPSERQEVRARLRQRYCCR